MSKFVVKNLTGANLAIGSGGHRVVLGPIETRDIFPYMGMSVADLKAYISSTYSSRCTIVEVQDDTPMAEAKDPSMKSNDKVYEAVATGNDMIIKKGKTNKRKIISED